MDRIMKPIVLILFSMLFFSVAGQINGDVRLVDEFDPRPCETLVSRLDSFAADITNEPGTIGYILIRNGTDLIDNAVILRATTGHIKFRQLPSERFVIIPAEGSGDVTIELWKSRNGKTPHVIESSIGLGLPREKERVFFAEDIVELVKVDGTGAFLVHGCEVCCMRTVDSKLLSEFLKANRSFNAEFTIKSKSKRRYRRATEILRKEFLSEWSVGVEQLKFLYGGNDKELKAWGGQKVVSVTVSLVRKTEN